MRLSRIFNYKPLLAIICGAVLPLAFAPFHLPWFALLCPLAMLFLWQDSTPKAGFIIGLCFGLGFFGIGASWVYVSIHYYGNTGVIGSCLLTAIFILIYSLVHGLQGWLWRKMQFSHQAVNLLLLYPATWILAEAIRSLPYVGFPWLLLGYSQVQSPLAGIAPILGGYGITLTLTFLAGLWYFAIKQNWRYLAAAFCIHACIYIGSNALRHQEWTTPSGKPISIAMLQGNISLSDQYNDEMIDSILRTYSKMTEQNWQNRLIIWPESAIPIPLYYAKNVLARLDFQAKLHHSNIITGIPIRANIKNHYTNSIIEIGESHGRYAKQHLVPFGDYLPLESYLRGVIGFFNIPMSDFVKGNFDQDLMHAAGISIVPFVCYDIVYTDFLLKSLPQGQLLLTVSNDAWFRHSIAAEQQLQISQLRALQSGRYLLYSNNTGITAVIDPHGKIKATLPIFEKAVLQSHVQAMNGATPWSKIGDIIFVLLSLFIIVLRKLLTWGKMDV